MELVHSIGERVATGPNAPNLAFLILLLALIVAPMLAGCVRLPAMVGLVLAGMLIGPHGLGILATQEIALSALGDFGLLYLMFNAGVELDLRQLVRHKRIAIAFAALSFAVPFALGLASAKLLGYAWLAAVLMGSNWGSHTLVTYPEVRRLGLARNRAASTVVGATAVTDTAALLVLAAVSVAVRRDGSFFEQSLEMVIGLAILVAWSVLGLPRVARWFFARVGSNAAQRFLFAVGAFFLGAILAESAGIDGIVGAFFAGLGLGRAIPAQSSLMDRVQFVGGALFIPVFLVSVGTLLEPAVLLQPRTLLYALVFTVTVLGGKAIAAYVVGTRASFGRAEIGLMSGLSGSQAAATLATTLVGARLGLFDTLTINAVLVVILATLIITPLVVSRFGRALATVEAGGDAAPIGRTILVPVWGDSSRPLLGVAGRLAEEDTGMVVAGSFVSERASDAELARRRRLRAEAEDWLADAGLEARSLLRISRSDAAGLLQTARGERATMIVSEWEPIEHGRLAPEEEIRDLLGHAPVPIVLAHGTIEPFGRLILVVERADELSPPGRFDLEIAHEIGTRLAHGRPVDVVTVSVDPIDELFARIPRVQRISTTDPLAWVERHARTSDLVLFPGLAELRDALARIPDLVRRRFLVAIAAAHPA